MPRCADASCVRWRPAFGVWGGVRLNGTWFCSRSCAATAVRRGLESPPAVGESAGSLPPLRIGALLRHQGAITQAQLDAAVASQRAAACVSVPSCSGSGSCRAPRWCARSPRRPA